MRTPYLNELYHYGVMGMHWGVRRYQNPDGTLTAAGKKHYNAVLSDSGRYPFSSKNAARAKAMKDAGYSRSEIGNAISKKRSKSKSDLVYISGFKYKVSEILKGAADYDGVTVPKSLLAKLFTVKFDDLDELEEYYR